MVNCSSLVISIIKSFLPSSTLLPPPSHSQSLSINTQGHSFPLFPYHSTERIFFVFASKPRVSEDITERYQIIIPLTTLTWIYIKMLMYKINAHHRTSAEWRNRKQQPGLCSSMETKMDQTTSFNAPEAIRRTKHHSQTQNEGEPHWRDKESLLHLPSSLLTLPSIP